MKKDNIGPILFLVALVIGPILEVLKTLVLLPFIILWAIAWNYCINKL